MKLGIQLTAVVIAMGFLGMAGCAMPPTIRADQTSISEPRIRPLAEAELTAEERKVLNAYRLPNGQLPNILTTMAGYPALLDKYLAFVSRDSTLHPRERELLILRVGWLRRSEFMLGWHTLYARKAGLTEEEIARIARGPGAAGWGDFDATLLLATDELVRDALITDATWNALARRYDEKQLIDLLFLVGQYDMHAMYLKSIGVRLDEGVPHFPVSLH